MQAGTGLTRWSRGPVRFKEFTEDSGKLSDEIHKWMHSLPCKIDILDVKYSTLIGQEMLISCALIQYKEWEEIT